MSDTIVVTHVCETAKGGIATYLRLVQQVTSSGVVNRAILPDSQQSDLGQVMECTVFADTGRGMRRLWRICRTTLSQVRNVPCDIIFFHSTFTLPVLALLRLVRVPAQYVYCAHGWAALRYPEGSFKRFLAAVVEGKLCGFADAVINISDYDQNYAQKAGYSGMHRLVENAVLECEGETIPAPFNRDWPQINLLFIGRFDKQKGLDLLLEAFAEARKNRPDLLLHVVGEAVLADGGHPELGRQQEGVTFHGWQNPARLQGYYEAADLLVVPSRWEGFGLVVPEALRAGTPVLVSDRGALPGLIDHGITGFVESLSITGFARVMGGLQKSTLHAMRPVCRQHYEERFHSNRFGDELCLLYKELVKNECQ